MDGRFARATELLLSRHHADRGGRLVDVNSLVPVYIIDDDDDLASSDDSDDSEPGAVAPRRAPHRGGDDDGGGRSAADGDQIISSCDLFKYLNYKYII